MTDQPVNVEPGNPWFAPLERPQKLFLGFFTGAFVLLAGMDLIYRGISPFQNVWWYVSFVVSLIIPAFLKARRLALGSIIQGLSLEKSNFQQLFEEYKKKKETGWESFSIGILVGGFFFLVTIMSSNELFLAHGSFAFWLKALVFGFGFGLFGKAFWLNLCFGFLVNQMSKELEEKHSDSFSFELLERAGQGCGRISLGTGAISACLFWMFMANFWFFKPSSSFLPYQVFFTEAVFLLTILYPFVHLIFPQYRFHRMLVKRKGEIRRLFFSELLQTEKIFIATPNKELAQKYLLERQIIQEIENLPEWPFRSETLFPFLSVVAIPLILFFIKEIAVNVLVELLKR